jgi:nitroreductase
LAPPLPATPAFGAPLPVALAPEVLEFLALRRSTPALTLTAPAPSAAEVSDLLRLAARVPDHGKLTPWRFVVLEGESKVAFADRLDALAKARGDTTLSAKLGKLKVPPLALAVISSPKTASIPEWEQLLSSGVVCTNLLYGALAMGYGANWITDWYSFDKRALDILGVGENEKVAGFLYVGTSAEQPLERVRPDLSTLVSEYAPTQA